MSDEEYIASGCPFRTPDGRLFQNGSELALHNGFWWFDVGCAIAPAGQEVHLPLIEHPQPASPTTSNKCREALTTGEGE